MQEGHWPLGPLPFLNLVTLAEVIVTAKTLTLHFQSPILAAAAANNAVTVTGPAQTSTAVAQDGASALDFTFASNLTPGNWSFNITPTGVQPGQSGAYTP